MGLEVAGAVLELGGDVICIDRAAEPALKDLWGAFLSPSPSPQNSCLFPRYIFELTRVLLLWWPMGRE